MSRAYDALVRKSLRVDLAPGIATSETSPTSKTFEGPEFEKTGELFRLTIGNMTRATSAGRVEGALRKQPEVLSAQVHLASEREAVPIRGEISGTLSPVSAMASNEGHYDPMAPCPIGGAT